MATAPVVCLATWALFGIQEIGLLIEDPFQVRGCTTFCATQKMCLPDECPRRARAVLSIDTVLTSLFFVCGN